LRIAALPYASLVGRLLRKPERGRNIKDNQGRKSEVKNSITVMSSEGEDVMGCKTRE